ncbi:glycosyltransferase family 4 protein [Psychroflexus montanilacus]|uniref:glycosyltransferase family 4 protein n=1 Tax=Psychroflexus montanilacus TaxID=2873598 RepID=UPI001CCF6342|nr:glycosyltransferase family 4 protein [Psychroflexus montanilacus]MBZ9652092.1 glycosyltransferase family 4 protein [Psychroflexus montanilacus]
MRVLLVDTINNIPSHKQYQDLALKLSQKGHEVYHLSDTKRADYGLIKVIFYNKNDHFFLLAQQYYKVFRRIKPDVVISTFRSNIYVDLLSYLINFKWYATYQSAFFKKSLINRLRYRSLDNMITLSSNMKSELVKIYPHLKNRIQVVPNSINFEFKGEIFKKNILLHVGNDLINAEGNLVKGTDLLIKAFNLSKESLPQDSELHIIGAYSEQFKSKNYYKNVVFLGRRSHNEVLQHMSKARVFALPSRNEAFGQVYIEAMQYGCTLIGAEKTGAVDIIEKGVYGFLISQESELELSQAIDNSFNLYESPENCIEVYKEKINEFSRDSWLNRMLSLVTHE